MPSKVLVSVVIPAFNAGQFIRETLNSAVAQTHRDLEIIVVNDGSTDETPQIVTEFQKRDSRIILHSQERSGLAATRNRGINLSKGKWVAPLDADDLWHPQKIEKQLVAASGPGSEKIGLVYSWTQTIDEEGAHLYPYKPDGDGDVFVPLLLINLVGHGSGPLIRRDCLEEVGLYEEAYFRKKVQGCEDWDLYLRIARKYQFALVPDFLVEYRISSQSMSRNYKGMVGSFEFMLARLRALFPEIPRRAIRWSRSDFYYRQAGKARRNRDFAQGTRYMLRSAFNNPFRLGMTDTYRKLWELFRHREAPQLSASGKPRPVEAARKPSRRIGWRFFGWGKERMIMQARLAMSNLPSN